MTREEAISVLKVLASFQGVMEYLEQHSVSVQDACNMAISALEQTDIEQKAQEYEKAFMDGFESCFDLFTRNKEQQPCEDAISLEALKKMLRGLDKWHVKNKQFVNVGLLYDDVFFGIEQLPPVTQKSKTGHWIYDETLANWRCSKCNETPKTMGYVGTADFMAEHFKFCNHCGAKMESEDKTE